MRQSPMKPNRLWIAGSALCLALAMQPSGALAAQVHYPGEWAKITDRVHRFKTHIMVMYKELTGETKKFYDIK